ncbi:HD domain-containing protein [Candidatus Harpocratesius sp.]
MKLFRFDSLSTKTYYHAIEFAADAHRGQKRKIGGEPFILHPIAVAALLADYYNDKNLIIAAILHDVVEDTQVTLEEISREFGKVVADIVSDVSEPNKSLSWQERKQRYYNRLITTASISAIRLSAADKYHNLDDMTSWWKKQGGSIFTFFHAEKDEIIANYKRLFKFYEKKRIPWINKLWKMLNIII